MNQVYVTGLAPSAQMSLITASGQTLFTQSADSLGGLLFRDVPSGKGYRVLLDFGRAGIGADHRALRQGGALGSGDL